MKGYMPLTDEAGEVRELLAADMARFRPAHEVLPLDVQNVLGMRRRGAQKAPLKTATTVRLSQKVLDAFRATGKGWQTRMDKLLLEAVEQGKV